VAADAHSSASAEPHRHAVPATPAWRVRYRSVAGRVYRYVANEWGRVEITALASQVAYALLLSLPALVLLIMALAAIVDRRFGVPVADRLEEFIAEYSPQEIEELLLHIVDTAIRQVEGGVLSTTVALALFLGIWSASGGINALMNATNRAYGVRETRPWPKRRLRAVGLTVTTTVLVVGALAIYVLSQSYGSQFARDHDLGPTFDWVWLNLRRPMLPGLVMLGLIGLYQFGPAYRPPMRWTVPGAAFATALWLLALYGFGFWLQWVNPASPYGATGSVILLLLFLYLTGVAFILGAVVNGRLFHYFSAKDHPPNIWKV
jgi:membrane protein